MGLKLARRTVRLGAVLYLSRSNCASWPLSHIAPYACPLGNQVNFITGGCCRRTFVRDLGCGSPWALGGQT